MDIDLSLGEKLFASVWYSGGNEDAGSISASLEITCSWEADIVLCACVININESIM